MGYYGDEKTFQMIRSILPSTARKAVREEANHRRRRNRRVTAETLVPYKGCYAADAIELYDERGDFFDYYVEMHQCDGYPHSDYESIVINRRGSDKLNHFEHWAERITADMEPWDRMDYMRSLLPNNLIGRHAMSHLDNVIGYDPIRPNYQFSHWRAEWKAARTLFYNELWEALVTTVKTERDRDKLNAYLQQHCCKVPIEVRVGNDDHRMIYAVGTEQLRDPQTLKYIYRTYRYYLVYCDSVRLMRGYHDIRKFWNDVWARKTDKCQHNNNHHHDWLHILAQYLGIEVPKANIDGWFPKRRK